MNCCHRKVNFYLEVEFYLGPYIRMKNLSKYVLFNYQWITTYSITYQNTFLTYFLAWTPFGPNYNVWQQYLIHGYELCDCDWIYLISFKINGIVRQNCKLLLLQWEPIHYERFCWKKTFCCFRTILLCWGPRNTRICSALLTLRRRFILQYILSYFTWSREKIKVFLNESVEYYE